MHIFSPAEVVEQPLLGDGDLVGPEPEHDPQGVLLAAEQDGPPGEVVLDLYME